MKKLSVKALIIIFAGVIVLAISAALSVWLITAPDLKITVMSDPHMLVEEQIASYGSAAYQDQDADAQKMINISEAIIKTAIDDFIRSDSDILIVPGDITQDSSVISHTAFEAEIRRAEDAGKQVYIMPGNHDINHGSSMFGTETEQEIESISADDFTKLYSDYGYSEAVSRDPLTLSYAVDINKKYRLISIDTAYHPGFSPISFEGIKRNDSDLTPELTSWTINELNKAYSEGMTPIAMTHFPVVNHLGASVGSLSLAESSAVNGAAEFAEALADAGLKYLFTGHMHTQDIISYTSASGNTLYDIETASLTSYPCPVRTVTFYDSRADFRNDNMSEVNPDYLPDYLPAGEKAEIINDFRAYAESFYEKDFFDNLLYGVNGNSFLSIINTLVSIEDIEGVQALSEDIYDNLLMGFLHMPLYGMGDTLSVEKICSLYGVVFPNIGGEEVLDVVFRVLRDNMSGDEYQTDEVLTALKLTIYSLFYKIYDFDLFGKLQALDPSVAEIDLSVSLNTLFTEGKLNVVDNNLLLGALSFDIVSSILPFSITGGATTILTLASRYLANEPIMGINFSSYIDAENGDLLLGALIDNEIYARIGAEFISDGGPGDNNVRIYPSKNEWKVIG